jgi:hypothetical protein
LVQSKTPILGTVLGAYGISDEQVHAATRSALGNIGATNQNIGGKRNSFVVFKLISEIDAIRIFQQARQTPGDKHNPHVVTLAMTADVTRANKLGPRSQFEMSYEGFLEALTALCIIRYPDPFKTLADRFDRFLRLDFISPIMKVMNLQLTQTNSKRRTKEFNTSDAIEVTKAAQTEIEHTEKPAASAQPTKKASTRQEKEYGQSLVADIVAKSQM